MFAVYLGNGLWVSSIVPLWEDWQNHRAVESLLGLAMWRVIGFTPMLIAVVIAAFVALTGAMMVRQRRHWAATKRSADVR